MIFPWLKKVVLSPNLSAKMLSTVFHIHTAGLDTIFIQIYMDVPPSVPGVSKELEGHKVFLHKYSA